MMPSSIFAPWHAHDGTRHGRRVDSWEAGRASFTAWATSRGWEVIEPDTRVDVSIGRARASWTPSTGNCRLPGDRGTFRCFDAVQFAVLLTYAAKRLGWQERRGQVPWVSRRPWSDMETGPFTPPWSPQEDR